MKKIFLFTLILFLNSVSINGENRQQQINSIIELIIQSTQQNGLISNSSYDYALKNELLKYFNTLPQDKIEYYYDGLKIKGFLKSFVGEIFGLFISRNTVQQIRKEIIDYLRKETNELDLKNGEKFLSETEKQLSNERLLTFYLNMHNIINSENLQIKRSHHEKIEKIRQILQKISKQNESELLSKYKDFTPTIAHLNEQIHTDPSSEIFNYYIQIYDSFYNERQINTIYTNLSR